MRAREHARVWLEVSKKLVENMVVTAEASKPLVEQLAIFAFTISEAYMRAAEKDPD